MFRFSSSVVLSMILLQLADAFCLLLDYGTRSGLLMYDSQLHSLLIS